MTYTKEQLRKIRDLAYTRVQVDIDPDGVGRTRQVSLSIWRSHGKERAYINVHKEGRRTESDGYIDLITGSLHPVSSLASALYCLKGFDL